MEKPRTPALALLAVLVVASAAAGMLPLSGAQDLCNMTQDELTSCRPAIAVVQPVPKPSDACCAALAHADLACLCAYKNSVWMSYLRIDPGLAMQLPAKCNLNAPTQCS